MASQLELKVLLTGLDKLTSPLKSVQAVGKASSAQIKTLNNELKGLKNTAGQINEFQKLKTAVAASGQALKEVQSKAAAAAKALREAEKPTRALNREFEQAKQKAATLKASHATLQTSLQRQRDVLAQAGIETHKLSAAKSQLTGRSRELTKQIEAERQKMRLANDQAKAMAAAQERLGRARTLSGNLAGAGFATGAL